MSGNAFLQYEQLFLFICILNQLNYTDVGGIDYKPFGFLLIIACYFYVLFSYLVQCKEYSIMDILLQAIPLLVGCPACLRNFLNLFCELSCSPNQSLFINVTSIAEVSNHRILYFYSPQPQMSIYMPYFCAISFIKDLCPPFRTAIHQSMFYQPSNFQGVCCFLRISSFLQSHL